MFWAFIKYRVSKIIFLHCFTELLHIILNHKSFSDLTKLTTVVSWYLWPVRRKVRTELLLYFKRKLLIICHIQIQKLIQISHIYKTYISHSQVIKIASLGLVVELMDPVIYRGNDKYNAPGLLEQMWLTKCSILVSICSTSSEHFESYFLVYWIL